MMARRIASATYFIVILWNVTFDKKPSLVGLSMGLSDVILYEMIHTGSYYIYKKYLISMKIVKCPDTLEILHFEKQICNLGR